MIHGWQGFAGVMPEDRAGQLVEELTAHEVAEEPENTEGTEDTEDTEDTELGFEIERENVWDRLSRAVKCTRISVGLSVGRKCSKREAHT